MPRLLFFALLLPFFASSSAAESAAVQVASSRASNYILSKRDPAEFTWKTKETAAAVLGVTGQNPGWRSEKSGEAAAVKHGARIALLDLIAGSPSYSGLDHSQLAQFLGVIRVLCDDARDFHGHDLIAEVEKRVNVVGIPAVSPANAVLALTMCVYGVPVAQAHLRKLVMPRRRSKRCSRVCFEKAALNILALSCMFRDEENYDGASIKTYLSSNIVYLNEFYSASSQEDIEGMSVFRKSLAVQAKRESPFVISVDDSATVKSLLLLQAEDGSFGDSVSVTALVLPALTDFTGADLKSLQCFKEENRREDTGGRVRIHYEIVDGFTNSQSLVGDLIASPSVSVLDAFREYEQRFPEVFQVEVDETPFGTTIQSINGLRNDPSRRVSWKIYKKAKKNRGGEKVATEDPAKTFYEAGDEFVLKYEQN